MTPESILFKHIHFVTEDGVKTGDIYIKKGKILAVEPSLSTSADLVISEKNLTAFPGVIDPHVHFREPGFEAKETIASGSRAAAAGGVTTFFEMPNTSPPAISIQAIAHKKAMAAQTSAVNYNFFIGATESNLEELLAIQNVPGIKVFMGSSTGDLLMDNQDALEILFKQTHKLICIHAEDEKTILQNKASIPGTDVSDHEKIRNPEAALIATKRAVDLALRYQKRLHICHLTTKEEVYFLSSIQSNLITCEVTPQHLSFASPKVYQQWQSLAKINPPLRDVSHQGLLWKGLEKGVIGCMGSDHAPHTLEEKLRPYEKAPSGMPMVELTLPLMLTHYHRQRCRLTDLVRWLSSGPATIFGVSHKGRIAPGYDADLVLVDLDAKRTVSNAKLHTKAKWSILEGETLQGWPIMTLVNGGIVFREGEFLSANTAKEVICG